MRAVVYEHEEQEGLGLVEPALLEVGFELDVRMRGPRPDDVAADLLVVMGGLMGVYEASRHPFLVDELRVLHDRLLARRPVLGLCLGAQLMAAAAGARVFPGTNGMELGVEPVELTDAGRADPSFGALPSPFDAAHWHQDTWDEIPGAVVLAGTARYPQQAFRLGPSYGLQFHAELTAAMLSDWVQWSPGSVEKSGKSDGQLAQEGQRLRRAEPVMRALLDRLADALAKDVRRRRPER